MEEINIFVRDRCVFISTIFLLLLFGVIHCVTKNDTFSYYLNFSSSQPIGIYHKPLFNGHLQKNDLVFIKVPSAIQDYVYGRKWLPKGGLLLKNVGGLPGDVFQITNNTFSINQVYIGPVSHFDSQGRPLPCLRGTYKVKNGYFLPVSTWIPNSFDGRYFGAIPVKLIIGKAKPILIFKK